MRQPKPIRVAVLGVGSLGKEHARIRGSGRDEEPLVLSGLCDVSEETARKVAERHNTRRFASWEEAAAESDALSVVTPTMTHHHLARELLLRGKHVLVEKPMTSDSVQAAELVALAQKQQVVLASKIGAYGAFSTRSSHPFGDEWRPRPKFIEAHRLSPFTARTRMSG